MRKIISLTLLIFTTSFYLLSNAPLTLAKETKPTNDFKIEIASYYQIDQAGVTQVTHNFTITNLTPTKYVDKYALNITAANLQNIAAYEDNTYLKPHVVADKQSTSIALNFTRPTVGLNQQKKFKISYQDQSLATIYGQVLEVNIPKIKSQNYQKQTATVVVPDKFSVLSYAQPKPTSTTKLHGQLEIKFNNLNNQPITLVFGKKQIFDITIRYGLENRSQSTGIMQIAVPPNTINQQVNYQNLDPKPIRIVQDQEGNWLASYKLEPNETKTVNLSLTALVTLEPNQLPIPTPDLTRYLTSTKYWPTTEIKIKQLSQTLKKPDQIYQYVVDTLNYVQDLNNHRRLGGLEALAQPDNAACEEFSDTFITLARAANIPARRLVGYAYSLNPDKKPVSLTGTDVLHAWADYFDSQTKQFRPVDPTWEKTTGGRDYFHSFDLNHIVFAINGLNDERPLPAGLYLTDKIDQTKNINVTIGTSWTLPKPNFSLSLSQNKLRLPGIYFLKLTNETGVAWYLNNLTLSTDNPSTKIIILDQMNQVFLPFETKTARVLAVSRDALPHHTKLKLKINFNQPQVDDFQIGLEPVITALPTFGLESSPKARLISIGVGSMIIFTLLATSTVYIVWQKKHQS